MERNETERCPYCGAETAVIYECPKCYREGCIACMPCGRNCTCPECEEAEDREEE